MTTDSIDDASLLSDDDESTGSIFSSDDESSTTLSNLKELKDEFKARDELLEQLSEGIDPKFVRMMRRNEQAAREQKILQLKLCDASPKPGMIPLTPETSISSHCSSESKLTQVEGLNVFVLEDDEETSSSTHVAFAFYATNMLRAVVILLLNCIAYNGFEQIVRSFVVFLSGNVEFEHMRLLPFLMLLLSVGVLCLTGGIWEYANDDIYRVIKFDMKNRHVLGKWDALTAKWFHSHDVLEMSVTRPLCFFTCVYVVFAFQEQCMSWLFDIRRQLFQELPSVKQGVMTSVGERLATGLGGEEQIKRLLPDASCTAEEICNPYELHESLSLQDEAFLASNMAVDCYEDLMGDANSVLVTEAALFCYFAVSTIAAIVALRMMGHKFWSV